MFTRKLHLQRLVVIPLRQRAQQDGCHQQGTSRYLLRFTSTSPSSSSASSTTTTAASDSITKTSRRSIVRKAAVGVIAVSIPLIGISVHIRQWRQQQIQTTLDKATRQYNREEKKGYQYMWYPLDELILNMQRIYVMGHSVEGAKSVKEELDAIRQWHVDRGFKGGLVLRDLEQPLFGGSINDDDNSIDANTRRQLKPKDPYLNLARRECYYLYYERLPSAEMKQQVFCRGTELWWDVLTCLQAWYVYDPELDARLHKGFRNHADRLLEDLEPLLVKGYDTNATIEVQGHSLGGAVASIVALKLKQRGYNVTKLLTTASPRFCDAQAAVKLSPLLPEKTLRVEDDRDLVPLLPPFGSHLQCDKLWFVQDDLPRFIPKTNLSAWVDSFWINFRAWEILTTFVHRHRIANHIKEAEKID